MKLDLSDIFSGKQKEISFDYPLTIEDDFYGVAFPEPLYLKGIVKNMAGYISLKIDGKITYQAYCDRCTKPIEPTMEFEINRTVAQAKDVSGKGEEIEDDFLVVDGHFAELDDMVREEFVLSFPTKHLCKEDCLGLCSECGSDLNLGKCNCGTKEIDPKWANVLKILEE